MNYEKTRVNIQSYRVLKMKIGHIGLDKAELISCKKFQDQWSVKEEIKLRIQKALNDAITDNFLLFIDSIMLLLRYIK